jgi:Flp pilus assembly protein TadB
LEEESIRKEKARMADRAAQRARERAASAKWDTNILIFLFAILILVILLLFEGLGTVIVAPIAFVGLAMSWFVGWRREKQLYEGFYEEELSRYEEESGISVRRA